MPNPYLGQADAKLVSQLSRTTATIHNFLHRTPGATLNDRALATLVDRYQDLRAALNPAGYSQAWLDYCASIGADRSHDGYDLLA